MFGYGSDLDHIKRRFGSAQVIGITWGFFLKGLHVTLKVIKQELEFGLNLIALPSHTSHAPSTLICFFALKALNTKFKKEKDAIMTRSKYNEPNKIILTIWVDKALNQRLQEYRILTLRPWTTKLNHQAFTHQELQIVKVKIKMITHQMAKLVQVSNGRNKL
jgi:hypothetical protein